MLNYQMLLVCIETNGNCDLCNYLTIFFNRLAWQRWCCTCQRSRSMWSMLGFLSSWRNRKCICH
jgi:hypothetical protein